MNHLNLSSRSVIKLVEKAIEHETGERVNKIKVDSRLNHGDNQLFSVIAELENRKLKLTLAIDVKTQEI